MDFGAWLKRELQHRSWSMADIAKMIGVQRSTVSRWMNEQRIPEPSTCQRLAAVLGIPEDVVLARAGHVVFREDRAAQLRLEISALEDQYARDIEALEALQEKIDQLHQELQLLDEAQQESFSPLERVITIVREADIPEHVRHELEMKVTEVLRNRM